MFRIIKVDGTEIGITDSVNYIKVQKNGCFGSASKEDAVGIAYHSIAYNLFGFNEISNAETVVVSEIDTGYVFDLYNEENRLLKEHLAETDEVAIDLFEAGLYKDNINAEQDEALIEIYEMIGGAANG